MPLTTFDPTQNGFSFANNWTLTDAQRTDMRAHLTQSLERASALLVPSFPGAFIVMRLVPRLASTVAGSVPDGYGLCGGMAFAALDYWRVNPDLNLAALYQQRPVLGGTLHTYLWRRLLDSLALNAPTFLAWIAMLHLVPSGIPFRGGRPWLLARTREQLDELDRRLAQGQPVPIGLVGESRDPFMDHQVLAYDAKPQGPGHWVVYVYDMNCPGTPQTIDLDVSGSELVAVESCPGGRGRLRGLFCEAYRPDTPP